MPNLATDLARVLALSETAVLLRREKEEGAAKYYFRQFEREAADFLRFYGPCIAETFKETPNG